VVTLCRFQIIWALLGEMMGFFVFPTPCVFQPNRTVPKSLCVRVEKQCSLDGDHLPNGADLFVRVK